MKLEGTFLTEILETAKIIYNEKGIIGFYVGLRPYLLYSMISWATYFTLYEYFKLTHKKKI